MRDGRGHLLAAVVVLAVLTGCGGNAGGEPPASGSSASLSTTGVATATPFPDSTEPVAVEPGTYQIPRSAWSVADFTVTFPGAGRFSTATSTSSTRTRRMSSVSMPSWSTRSMPMRVRAATASPRRSAPTSMTSRRAAQAVRPEASGPVDTTLGGYPATRIDLTVPKGFDLKVCNAAGIGLQIWYSPPADKNFVLLSDGIASVYIVDVDGQRQVFLTQYRSAASDKDIRELQAVLDSIQIEA